MSDHLQSDSAATNQVTDKAISWRLGVYGGAIVGGILWGVVAATTVGARGDDAHLHDVAGIRLLVAAGVSLILAAFGVALWWVGRGRVLRGFGVALVVGPLSGWLVLLSLVLQREIH